MPWRYQISITKCLYSSREDLPKKLFKITVQEGKKPFSVDSCSSKTSLLKIPRRGLTNTDWEHCFQTSLVYSRNRRASSYASSHESDKFHLHSHNLLVLLSLRKTRDLSSLDFAQQQLKMVLLAWNQQEQQLQISNSLYYYTDEWLRNFFLLQQVNLKYPTSKT